MLTLHLFASRSSAAVLSAALLGAPGAQAAQNEDSLSARLTGMSGTGLVLAAYQERLQTLGDLLGQAGYSPMRTWLSDGTVIARCYHPLRHTNVLSFAGWNTFSAKELAGQVRWNEFAVRP